MSFWHKINISTKEDYDLLIKTNDEELKKIISRVDKVIIGQNENINNLNINLNKNREDTKNEILKLESEIGNCRIEGIEKINSAIESIEKIKSEQNNNRDFINEVISRNREDIKNEISKLESEINNYRIEEIERINDITIFIENIDKEQTDRINLLSKKVDNNRVDTNKKIDNVAKKITQLNNDLSEKTFRLICEINKINNKQDENVKKMQAMMKDIISNVNICNDKCKRIQEENNRLNELNLYVIDLLEALKEMMKILWINNGLHHLDNAIDKQMKK